MAEHCSNMVADTGRSIELQHKPVNFPSDYLGHLSKELVIHGGGSSTGGRVVVCQPEGCWFDPRAPPS